MPRLLDLFCGAGGCAVGYARAGFEVVGVDLAPQPRYPYEFHLADALTYPLDGFDAIHASPPCQAYAGVTAWRGDQASHARLIEPVRERLEASGLPWVLENVRTKECRADFLLCGTALGLPIRRHRHFETNWSGLVMSTPCQHAATDLPFMHKRERAYADAMGCEWMTNVEARQAIPPAYSELIGGHLLEYLAAPRARLDGMPTATDPPLAEPEALEAPLTVTQAARALKRRPETIHRWIAAGRIETVMVPNATGREVRRIPRVAVLELIAAGARGDVDPPGAEAEAEPELRAIAEQTISTLQAALEVRDSQLAAAAASLEAPMPRGRLARRRALRERHAAAAAAIRLLAALPAPILEDADAAR